MSYPLEPKFVCRPCLKASWGPFAGTTWLGNELRCCHRPSDDFVGPATPPQCGGTLV